MSAWPGSRTNPAAGPRAGPLEAALRPVRPGPRAGEPDRVALGQPVRHLRRRCGSSPAPRSSTRAARSSPTPGSPRASRSPKSTSRRRWPPPAARWATWRTDDRTSTRLVSREWGRSGSPPSPRTSAATSTSTCSKTNRRSKRQEQDHFTLFVSRYRIPDLPGSPGGVGPVAADPRRHPGVNLESEEITPVEPGIPTPIRRLPDASLASSPIPATPP